MGWSPPSRDAMPLKAAPTVVCARTRLRPHATSCQHELEARDTRAARRPGARTYRQSAAFLGGRARIKAGDACTVLQTPRRLRWQRSGQRVARRPSSLRRRRATPNIGAAHGQRAVPDTLKLHRAYRSRVERGTATSLEGRFSRPTTEATSERCSVSLDEPGVHGEREHLATPRGVSPAGRLEDDRH